MTNTTISYQDNIRNILPLSERETRAVADYRGPQRDPHPYKPKKQRFVKKRPRYKTYRVSFYYPPDKFDYSLDELRDGYQSQCKTWATIIAEYTARELTEPEDRLRALAGVANYPSCAWEVEYIYGLWRNALPDLLQWVVVPQSGIPDGFLYTHSDWRRPYRFVEDRPAQCSSRAPSWSWASLSCPVGYIDNLMPDATWRKSEIEVIDVGSLRSDVNGNALTVRGFVMTISEFPKKKKKKGAWLGDKIIWYPDSLLEHQGEGNIDVLRLLSSVDRGHIRDEFGNWQTEIILILCQVSKGIYTREGVGIRHWDPTGSARLGAMCGAARQITII